MLKKNTVQPENSFDPEYVPSLTKALKIIKKLDDLGMLDYINGILEEDNTMKSVYTLIKSDEAISFMANADHLTALLAILSDKDNINAIVNLATIISALQKVGLLDPVIGMLKDDDVINAVMSLISNDFTMNLIANGKPLLNSLGKLDIEKMPKYIDMLNAIGSDIENDKVPSVKGLTGLIHELENKDTQKGLGIVFHLLKSLGKANSKSTTRE